jgi:hypothetical protein
VARLEEPSQVCGATVSHGCYVRYSFSESAPVLARCRRHRHFDFIGWWVHAPAYPERIKKLKKPGKPSSRRVA